MMKKTMLIAIGIAGMFLGTPLAESQASVGVNVRLGERRNHKHYYYRNGHRRYYRHSGLTTAVTAMKVV